MLAASVMLALFASTLAAPSLYEGVGDVDTTEAARSNREVESFMVDYVLNLGIWHDRHSKKSKVMGNLVVHVGLCFGTKLYAPSA